MRVRLANIPRASWGLFFFSVSGALSLTFAETWALARLSAKVRLGECVQFGRQLFNRRPDRLAQRSIHIDLGRLNAQHKYAR